LYFGTKAGDVWALNADDGTVLWRFEADGAVWSKPAVTDDAIYVTSMDGVLHKLDRDGNEQWSFASPGAGVASNPTVVGDSVYFGSFDKKLYAVSTDDGAMRWSVDGDNWFWGTPAVGDGVVYAPNLDGRVYAVREDDGSSVWEFDAGAPVRSAPALVEDGLVVAARDGDVFKLDLENGQPVGGPVIIDSTIESNLTTDGEGRVFVVPRDATLYVIDATGNLTASSFQLNR
jgi:outer membrane protein assembly factor BamB